MRDINAQEVTKAVSHLFQEANCYLPEDVIASLKQARESEESPSHSHIPWHLDLRGLWPYAGHIPRRRYSGRASRCR